MTEREQETASPTPEAIVDPEAAIVRIESVGTFYDPLAGSSQEFATGSGFIIDPSGLVVTNNHVVAGGTAWNVFVGSEETALHARLVGTSECDDLAVLELQGVDEELPSLRWHESEVEPGLEVHSAGFPPNPEGDYVYRYQPGEVTSAATTLSTDWAAIGEALEHSATIRGGNSGGPLLVDADNSVAGVNYASTGTDNYAIAADAAQDVVETLATGQDLNSIGINGQAIASEDGTLYGVWVGGVKGGSPAHNAEIRAGDLITHINGVEVGTDGTMRQYCDILRSQGATAQLDINLVSFDEQTCYVAYLNRPGRAPAEAPCAAGLFDTGEGGGMDATSILSVYAPPEISATCEDAAEAAYSGALGSIICDGPSDLTVYYDLFPDLATLTGVYDSLSASAGVVDAGDCSTGPAEHSWLNASDEPGGRYACYERSDGTVTLVFTDTNALVIGTAIGDAGEWALLYDAFLNGEI